MNACVAAMTFRCELCQDRRRFFSATLKREINCPCCNRRQHKDPSGLKALVANESERRQQLGDREAMRRGRELAKALEFASRVASKAKELDPTRAPVDRIMQRWSVGEGSGLPRTSDEMDMAAQLAAEQADTFSAPPARSPPLDDESQIVVDRAVLHAPRAPWDMQQLIRAWYISPKPAHIIAEDCFISPRQIYNRWHDALDHLRERFVESRNATLMRMLLALA